MHTFSGNDTRNLLANLDSRFRPRSLRIATGNKRAWALGWSLHQSLRRKLRPGHGPSG